MDENIALAVIAVVPLVCLGLLVLLIQRRLRSREKARWYTLVVGNLLILAFLASLSLLAGEIYFRYFYDTTDALGYTKVCKRWYERHWHVNSSDCRDDIDYGLTPKSGNRRITFVGDSFTAGHGITNEKDRFGNRLRELHPEWEIHLLAQPGFDTGNELTYLENTLNQGYKLDEVVLVYCPNDVTDMFPQWTETIEKIRAANEQRGWLLKNSYFLNTLYYRLNARRPSGAEDYFRYVREGYEGDHWERQKQRLKALHDLVVAHGGHLSVVTFPFMHALGPNYEYQSAHDKLNRLWADLQTPHLDLLSIYRDLPPEKVTVNRFDGHPNEFANALAAKAIEVFLTEQLRTNASR